MLTAAVERHLPSAVIASSICAYGMTFARHPFSPSYVPIDEKHPLTARDVYGLSKVVDERTGRMVADEYGISVVALRFHAILRSEEARNRAAQLAETPKDGARDLWSYMDIRDAAAACWLGSASGMVFTR